MRIVEWIAAVILVVKVCSSSVFFLASSTALALASAVSNFSFCLFHAAQLGPELAPEFPPEFPPPPCDEELFCLSWLLLFSFLDLLRPMVRERRGVCRGVRDVLARVFRAPLGGVGIAQGIEAKWLRHDVGVESADAARHAAACPWVCIQNFHGTFTWSRPCPCVCLAVPVTQGVAHDQGRHVSVSWECDQAPVDVEYVIFALVAPDVGRVSVCPRTTSQSKQSRGISQPNPHRQLCVSGPVAMYLLEEHDVDNVLGLKNVVCLRCGIDEQHRGLGRVRTHTLGGL